MSMGKAPFARSFRMTTPLRDAGKVGDFLEAQGFRFEPEPFSPHCWRLTEEPFPLGSSLAAFFGYIYIQDRSSMLPPLALAPRPGSFVLDMCASPGSKTSFLCQLCGEAGMTLANEPNPDRLGTLRSNLERLNFFNNGACNYDGRKLPLRPESVPAILLDPPCSGWGTELKHPETRRMWREDKIAPLVSLQRQLLRHAATLLAPGGSLVYSTCTTNSAENEDQVEFAARELALEIDPLEPMPGFIFDERLLSKGMLEVNGEASGSQGFFISRLRKKERPDHRSPSERMFKPEAPLPDIPVPPGGMAAIFGNKARFLPELASRFLPNELIWQAPALGAWKEGLGFKPKKSLRYPALFQNSGYPAIVFENVSQIGELLSGREISVGFSSSLAELWWRDLPLGFAAIKNGRLVNPFRGWR